MISIIIPAHNEEAYIEQCLKSITNQKYRNYEIIVICDACTDNTTKIAKRYTQKVYSINKKNVSAARNYGAKKAKDNILVFLDADIIIAPNLLFEIEKVMKRGVIGGFTKTRSLEPLWKANILWGISNLGRYIFPAASGMLFCKKEIFSDFDELRRIAEDTHLLLQLKKKGKLKYITNSFVKTSARRWEKEGYFKTILRQYKAFFVKDEKGYSPSKNPL